MDEPVSDGQIAEHLPYIKRAAERFSRLEVPLCEYDDLVQVGSIRVWKLLRERTRVTHTAILNAMRDELRKGARSGRWGIAYEPFPDDLDVLAAVDAAF